MRNIHVILLAALVAGACTDPAPIAPDPAPADPAPSVDPVTGISPALQRFIAEHHRRSWAEVAPLVAIRYGTPRAQDIERALRGSDAAGNVPAEFLPVVLPSGTLEVTADTLRRYASGELSPQRDFAAWVAAGLFDPADPDQLAAAAQLIGVPPPAPAVAPPPPPPVCNWNCKIKLQFMVAKNKTSTGDESAGHSCSQYSGDYWKKTWDGAAATFEASGGTVWRNNLFAPAFCLKDTEASETGKYDVIGTVTMTTEALDAKLARNCPGDLNAGITMWGEAHETAQLSCIAKNAGKYGFSSSNDDPWECHTQGGVGCSVSGVAEQQLIVTAEHKPECENKQAVSVDAKWSKDKGWELAGGGSSETTCKKTLDAEATGIVDCQILHGPDIAWHSSDNPRPTVHATIGGKTFQAKAKSLTSWREGFFSLAQRIRTDGTAKTTAASAKVHIAASCSTNHPNDTGITCEVAGAQADGF